MEHYISAADSVRLWTKSYGHEKNEACLFINGAGANTSFWSERLCSGLVETDLEGFLPVWKYLNGTASFDNELAIDYTRKLYERQ